MSAAPRLRMTFDDFLDWESRQETKHEYYRGEVFPMIERTAMAGGTATHATIITNAIVMLSTGARARGCRVFSEAMRVRVEAADLSTYPDLSVVCGEVQFLDRRETALLNPLVLVEVLSPSTASYDRGAKFDLYAQIPSLRDYVLIGQDAPSVHVYSRDGEDWKVTLTTDGAARVPVLDMALDLGSLYDGVIFPRPEEHLRPTPGV